MIANCVIKTPPGGVFGKIHLNLKYGSDAAKFKVCLKPGDIVVKLNCDVKATTPSGCIEGKARLVTSCLPVPDTTAVICTTDGSVRRQMAISGKRVVVTVPVRSPDECLDDTDR